MWTGLWVDRSSARDASLIVSSRSIDCQAWRPINGSTDLWQFSIQTGAVCSRLWLFRDVACQQYTRDVYMSRWCLSSCASVWELERFDDSREYYNNIDVEELWGGNATDWLTDWLLTAAMSAVLNVTRNAWQSLAYSPLGAVVSPMNYIYIYIY